MSDAMESKHPDHAQMYAVKVCLDELLSHAKAQDLLLAATLIAAASDAVSDAIFEREAANR